MGNDIQSALTDEVILEAMQFAWDDFVADTGCYPDDFTVKRGKLTFVAGRWASFAAGHIRAAAIRSLKRG